MLSAPGDYTAQSNVSVTFQPNEDTQTVTVTIDADGTAESTEQFFGHLQALPGSEVNVTAASATIEILDTTGESVLVL